MALSPLKQILKKHFIEYHQAMGKSLEEAEAKFNEFTKSSIKSTAQDYWIETIKKYEDKDRNQSEESFYQHALKKAPGFNKFNHSALSNEEIDKINDVFGGDPIPKVE